MDNLIQIHELVKTKYEIIHLYRIDPYRNPEFFVISLFPVSPSYEFVRFDEEKIEFNKKSKPDSAYYHIIKYLDSLQVLEVLITKIERFNYTAFKINEINIEELSKYIEINKLYKTIYVTSILAPICESGEFGDCGYTFIYRNSRFCICRY
ncbi:MAG: hypothetical protein ABIO44_01545 [Saprospiraceae bacterium]